MIYFSNVIPESMMEQYWPLNDAGQVPKLVLYSRCIPMRN